MPHVAACVLHAKIPGSDHAALALSIRAPSLPPAAGYLLRGNLTDGRHEQDLARSDWKLNPVIFNVLNSQFGPFCIDLFASSTNSQLPRYVTRFPDNGAYATDAFSFDWSFLTVGGGVLYANPPWCELSRVLAHFSRSTIEPQCQLVLIAPVWTDAEWWHDIIELSWRTPLLLPSKRDLFLPGFNQNRHGVGYPNWDPPRSSCPYIEMKHSNGTMTCRHGQRSTTLVAPIPTIPTQTH